MAITYHELILEMRKRLRSCGVENDGVETRLIVCHESRKSREELLRDARIYAADDIEAAIRASIERRCKGEPAAYIVGAWEFMGHAFVVTPDVLVPRMDSEVIVAETLKFVERQSETRILDLCAGSGALGISVALERPRSRVALADLSKEALGVARRNIRLHSLSNRVVAVQCDAREPLPDTFGTFDVIICNPPYIPAAVIETLDASVRDFEPRMALDGGMDGLDFYRDIVPHIGGSLKHGGRLLFEVGISEANYVAGLMAKHGFTDIEITEDSGGIQRVVSGGRV